MCVSRATLKEESSCSQASARVQRGDKKFSIYRRQCIKGGINNPSCRRFQNKLRHCLFANEVSCVSFNFVVRRGVTLNLIKQTTISVVHTNYNLKMRAFVYTLFVNGCGLRYALEDFTLMETLLGTNDVCWWALFVMQRLRSVICRWYEEVVVSLWCEFALDRRRRASPVDMKREAAASASQSVCSESCWL